MKVVTLMLSLTVGMACGYLVGHLLGPAPGTRYDTSYRSRLDQAVAEGRDAAAARTQELWQEFARRKGQTPPAA